MFFAVGSQPIHTVASPTETFLAVVVKEDTMKF